MHPDNTGFAQPVLFVTFGYLSFTNHTRPLTNALLLLICSCFGAGAQSPTFNFHQLSTSNGLHDPTVRAIAQDKYGYIWIGTSTGLNRFNGYEVKVFQHKIGDSLSLPENRVFALLVDNAGTLWIAQPNGISRYDYSTSHFIYQPGSRAISAYKIL